MMSNANHSIVDPTAAAGQGRHSNPRNIQFRISASQQQQLHHHHQQQHDVSGHGNISSKSVDPAYTQPRLASNMPLSQHQIQFSHSSQSHSPFNSNLQQQQQIGHPPLQHQQRPPISPAHQPRLHHSASAGNISVATNT